MNKRTFYYLFPLFVSITTMGLLATGCQFSLRSPNPNPIIVNPDNPNIAVVMGTTAAITGGFAGFAFAIVVLFIERVGSKDLSPETQALYEATLTTFITTFFMSLLAAYLFASGSGEQPGDSNRAFAILMFPASVLALSVSLLCLGFVLLLKTHRLNYVLDEMKYVQAGLIFTVLVYLSGAVDDATTAAGEDSIFFTFLACALAIGLTSSLVPRWYSNHKKAHWDLRGFRSFNLICFASSILAYLLMSAYVELQPRDWVAPDWFGLVVLTLVSALCGWSSIYTRAFEHAKSDLATVRDTLEERR